MWGSSHVKKPVAVHRADGKKCGRYAGKVSLPNFHSLVGDLSLWGQIVDDYMCNTEFHILEITGKHDYYPGKSCLPVLCKVNFMLLCIKFRICQPLKLNIDLMVLVLFYEGRGIVFRTK